jgi:hypothetical protein
MITFGFAVDGAGILLGEVTMGPRGLSQRTWVFVPVGRGRGIVQVRSSPDLASRISAGQLDALLE